MFVPVNEGCSDSELPGNVGIVVELSMGGSTLTLHDTDVVEQLTEGICIIIIGLIEEVSKFNSR
jgi:hypothetical protein